MGLLLSVICLKVATFFLICFGEEEGFPVWIQAVMCSLPLRTENRGRSILFSIKKLASEIGMI